MAETAILWKDLRPQSVNVECCISLYIRMTPVIANSEHERESVHLLRRGRYERPCSSPQRFNKGWVTTMYKRSALSQDCLGKSFDEQSYRLRMFMSRIIRN
jgi:hypothetical protein